MRAVKSLFDLYINSSIHVSLAIVSFALVTSIYFEVSPDIDFYFFLFFASITGYNFVKYAGIAKLHHSRLARNLKIIQVFSFFAFFGLIYTAIQQSYVVLGIAVFLGLITLFYAVPISPGNKNLRNLTGAKIFIIALVCTGATVIMPLIDYIEILKWNIIIHTIEIFCLIIVLILPFEIRDLKFDMVQLRTIPQQFGVRKTKLIGIVVTIAVVLLELMKTDVSTVNSASVILICVVTILALRYSTIRQSPYFSSFWVEGIPLLWVGILLLLNNLFS